MVHHSSRCCSTAGTLDRAFRTNACILRNLRHGLLVAAVAGGTLPCEAGEEALNGRFRTNWTNRGATFDSHWIG